MPGRPSTVCWGCGCHAFPHAPCSWGNPTGPLGAACSLPTPCLGEGSTALLILPWQGGAGAANVAQVDPKPLGDIGAGTGEDTPGQPLVPHGSSRSPSATPGTAPAPCPPAQAAPCSIPLTGTQSWGMQLLASVGSGSPGVPPWCQPQPGGSPCSPQPAWAGFQVALPAPGTGGAQGRRSQGAGVQSQVPLP